MDTSIFNPHYNRAYGTVDQLVNRHHEELLQVTLNFFEHKDKDGRCFQISPWLDVRFKGFYG